jgi:hypothetical protein
VETVVQQTYIIALADYRLCRLTYEVEHFRDDLWRWKLVHREMLNDVAVSI